MATAHKRRHFQRVQPGLHSPQFTCSFEARSCPTFTPRQHTDPDSARSFKFRPLLAALHCSLLFSLNFTPSHIHNGFSRNPITSQALRCRGQGRGRLQLAAPSRQVAVPCGKSPSSLCSFASAAVRTQLHRFSFRQHLLRCSSARDWPPCHGSTPTNLFPLGRYGSSCDCIAIPQAVTVVLCGG